MIKQASKNKKGFTLIELMIVVAIIGILAAIAIPNFIRFQLKSKSSEGKVNLAAIRTAEESYMAEFGNYVASAANPATAATTSKVAFDTGGGFETLGWAPEGNVYFQYAVGVDVEDFAATASADINGNGTDQVWGYIKTDSNGTAASPVHTCATAVRDTVAPCLAAAGQSEF